ncbi:MAG: sulfatase [Bacteroidia bacterium]|nr:sulfatase [Bacteroidia bacterium]
MNRIIVLLLSLNLLACESEKASKKAAIEKPNIVYIQIDDLGYKDLAFMGSDYYETPNLDALAASGMIFTQGYAGAANCAPSRACLMTGKNTPAHGVYTVAASERGNVKTRKIIPTRNTLHIKDSEFTLAELLKAEGYKTATFGKWHISEDPLRDGFDINFGGTKAGSPGREGYLAPYNNLPGLKEAPEGEYLTDRLTTEAIHFLKSHAAEKFFLYLPYFTVHTPLIAKDSLLKKYQNKAGSKGQKNPVYAAMVENMDTQIGRILSTLDQLRLRENTLIIFTSDNGGIRSISNQDPLRAGKGSYYEGGIRVPYIFSWPGKIAKSSKCNTPIVNLDIFPSLAHILGKEVKDGELDGKNIFPLLKGKNIPERNFYWHFPIYLQAYRPLDDDGRDPLFRTRPGSVIRSGNWKLHQYFEDGGLELYNLEEDLGERNNLAESNPAKTQELLDLLEAWRVKMNAPVPDSLNPEYEAGFIPERYRDQIKL